MQGVGRSQKDGARAAGLDFSVWLDAEAGDVIAWNLQLKCFISHDSPHFSDWPENVCEQRLVLQHPREVLHQRTQPGFRHRRDQIVEYAALTEQ